MDYGLIFLIAQWGVVGLFVLFHFVVGFIRGTRKTLYYTIVSLFLTFILFWGISFLSIRMFFSPGSLTNFIERYVTIPEQVRQYLVDPQLSAVLFAVIDIVIRLVAFLILYPILKKLLTWLVFSPIWKKYFKKDKKLKIALNKNATGLIAKEKNIKPNPLSRLGGSLIGAFRGLVVAFIFLMPLILLGSIVREVDEPGNNNSNLNHLQSILASNGSSTNDQVIEIIEAVQRFDKQGLGNFTKMMKIQGKPLEQSVFDFIFTTKVVTKDIDGNEQTNHLVISEDIKAVGQIARTLIEGGYLEEGYDYEAINYNDNYEDIDFVLTELGKSTIINLMIPIGVDIAARDFLPDVLGFNPADLVDNDGNKLHTKASIDALRKMNWQDEANSLSTIIEEALKFGSIKDYVEISRDPKLFLDLDNKDKRQLSEIIKSIAELNVLAAANIGVEYAIRQDSVLNAITWDEEPLTYIQDRLAFILENENYLVGNEGEIYNIAKLIDAVFADDFNDYNYNKLLPVNNKVNIDNILEEESTKVISAALISLAEIETIMKAIPFGLDYAVLELAPSFIDDVAEELLIMLNEVDYKEELNNVSDIYTNIATIGLEAYFNDKDTALEVTDSILKNDESVRAIEVVINNIFVESEVVNNGLEIIAEPLINKFITNEDQKDLALKVIDADFKYGQELVSVIKIAQSLTNFTSLNELSKIKFTNNLELLNLVSSFGSLSEEQYTEFKDNITSLQVVDIAGAELLHVLNKDNIVEQLVVPENANVGLDIGRILDIVYEVSKPLNQEVELGTDILDINFANIIDVQSLTNALSFNADDVNSVLYATMIEFVKRVDLTVDNVGTFRVPVEFINANYDDPLWLNEINSISKGLIDLTQAFSSEDEIFPLSARNLSLVKSLDNIPADVINRFGRENNINQYLTTLISSTILRYNGTRAVKKFSQLGLNKLKVSGFSLPEDIYDGDLIKTEEITQLIQVGAQLFYEFTPHDEASVNLTIKKVNMKNGVKVFNRLDDELINKIGTSNLFNGSFRDLMLNEDFQSSIYNLLTKVQLPQEIKDIDSGLFDYVHSLDSEGRILENTLTDLLLATRDLQIPYSLVQSQSGENVDNFIKSVREKEVDNFLSIMLVHETTNNLFKLDNLGYMTGNIVSTMFDINRPYIEMRPETDLLDNNDLFKKEEILLTLKAIKSLGITGVPTADTLGMGTIIDLIGKNEVNGEDDLHRLLNSQYTSRLLSRVLTSKTIKETIATGANIDPLQLKLNAGRYNEADDSGIIKNKYLTEEELYKLFVALEELGLNDFNNMNISNSMLKDLTEEELETVLESTYLYEVISLILVSEITQMPNEALVLSGRTKDFVKKDEIFKLVESLRILNLNNAESMGLSTIKISDLEKLINLDSAIITRLLSEELLTMSTLDIPQASMASNNLDLLKSELLNIAEVLTIISGNKETDISTIDTKALTISIAKFDELLLLTLEDNVTPSPFVTRMLSTTLIDLNTVEIPTNSMANSKDILYDELLNMSEVLKIVSNDEQADISTIQTSDIEITVVQYDALLALRLADGITPSPFVTRMLSKAVITSFTTIEDDITLDANGDVPHEELVKISQALKDLEITDVKNAGTDLTLSKLKTINDEDSSVIDKIYDNDGSEIVYLFTSKLLIDEIGGGNIPNNHYVNEDPLEGKLKRSSIQLLISQLP